MLRFLLLLSLVLVLAGCRNSAQSPTPNPDVTIIVQPQALTVGETVLAVTVTDAAGQPLNAAKVEVRGDMNHAGMLPVIAGSPEGQNGVFRIPFDWNMGGDWILTVTVTLADGTTAEQTFDYSIRD